MAKDDPQSHPSFEESLKKLDEIVRKLEGGELSLEESLALFESGVELSLRCRKQLEDAETKVEVLMKRGGQVHARSAEGELGRTGEVLSRGD